MILAACAPTAPATTEAPPAPVETEAPVVTEAPVATEAPATEEPVATEVPAMPTRDLLWTKGLRQAIAAAIDREVIVDRVFEGRNTPAYHMVPSDYPFATEPFLDKYGVRDLEMAKELLTRRAIQPRTFTLALVPARALWCNHSRCDVGYQRAVRRDRYDKG
jgi:ABC-type transport system substrate-binding protein